MKKRNRVQNRKLTKGSHRVLMWLATIAMTIYILWRCFFTIPSIQEYGMLAFVCGICLLVAESISAFEAFLHYSDMQHMVVPEKPEIPVELYPDVDVFIATHNEEVSLLYKTVNGCKHMRYPDPNKVHIYLCDDGNRPVVATLAQRIGVGYLPLAENKHAKAGNLNNALSKTHSPYVVTFDADMIPTSDFLMETVPYMFLPAYIKDEEGYWRPRTEEELDPKFKMGFIQSPQSFYNPDLFQYFLYSEARIPNEQDYFFREINVGRNRSGAPIYAGSNTLISREALDAVGGIAIGSITEDFTTGIKIQAAGFTCYAIDKVLAHGLAPTDLDSLIKQRERWGRGCISAIRQTHLLLNPGLKFRAKLAYLSAFLYWFTFARRFIYILAPILFVVFHIPVLICDLKSLLLIWLPSFLLYNYALKVSSGKIRSYRWSNIIDTILFPYLILPILAEALFIKLKKFHVTSKSHNADNGGDLLLGIPHLILLVFNLFALVISIQDVIIHRNYGGIVVLYWLLVNAFNLIMALLFVTGRRNLRSSDRFRVSLPVEVCSGNTQVKGVTADVSENGLAAILPEPVYLQDNIPVSVTISDRDYLARLQCTVASVSQVKDGWKYGLRIDAMEGVDRENYNQIVFDRHHSMSNIMQPTVSTFSDLSVNIQKRMQPLKNSQRKLPRIPIDRSFPMENGEMVKVADINYEYLRISDGETKALPQQFTLNFDGYLLELRKSEIRPNLYEILNREELLQNPGFTTRLLGTGEKAPV